MYSRFCFCYYTSGGSSNIVGKGDWYPDDLARQQITIIEGYDHTVNRNIRLQPTILRTVKGCLVISSER
jgi:hypothetical protein